MVLISNFELVPKSESKILLIKHNEEPICPICGERLIYRDCRKRIMRQYNGEIAHLIVRRLKCDHCGKLHTELPDVITPHKHYAREIIENVVQDICTPDDPETESYPCEKTMERWKDWIASIKHQVDGRLRSVGHRILEFKDTLLFEKTSLLEKLMEDGAGWLAIISRDIYNSGDTWASL